MRDLLCRSHQIDKRQHNRHITTTHTYQNAHQINMIQHAQHNIESKQNRNSMHRTETE